MINKKKKKILIFWGIIVLIFLCICYTNKTIENDVFYSIKVGASILKNGIDFRDHLSWITGLSYDYPHWLFDVLIYFLYSFNGFFAIYVFTIILFIIFIISLLFLNLKRENKLSASFITALITLIAISSFYGARAQIITYLVFLYEIYFIESFLKNKKKSAIIALLILPIIIANTHIALFYFYFILFLPYIAEYILALCQEKFHFSFLNERFIIKKNDNIKTLLCFVPLMFLMGLLGPLGSRVYTYYPKVVMGNSTLYIFEHDPWNYKILPIFFYLTLFIIASIFIFKIKIKAHDFFLFIGLSLMVVLHLRNYALFLVVCNFLLCDIITQYTKISLISKIVPFALCLILFFGISSGYKLFQENKETPFVSPYKYPVKAASYIKDVLLPSGAVLFNDYDDGSYLMLCDIPVFIDSRAELYTEPFNKKLTNFFPRVMRIENYYEEVFEEYHITHALVKRRGMLDIILQNHKNYQLIYKDGAYEIYAISQQTE